MALSDSELLHAAQSDGLDSEQARQELRDRFGRLLFYLAGHACRLNGLHANEAEDVVDIAVLALLDPTKARFDPCRVDKVEPYLRGLIQNAARERARFVRRGSDKRHDYGSPLNPERGLPSSIDDICDPRDGQGVVVSRDLFSAVIDMAGADERELIDRIFFAGEEPEDVAADLGVDRSTVSRRLGRFYRRVRARSLQLVGADPPCPN